MDIGELIMKLTRRQLKKIILESINEDNFIDRIKKKGKDIKDKTTTAVDRVKGKVDDIRGGDSESVSEPSRVFSSKEEVMKMLKEKYPVGEGKEQKIFSHSIDDLSGDTGMAKIYASQDAREEGYQVVGNYSASVNEEMILFVIAEKDKAKTGRVLAYFQDGEDYVLGNNGKMLFKDASGKRVTLQFRGPNLKPFFRVQGPAGQFQPVQSVQFLIGLGIPGLTPTGSGKVTKEEVNEASQFLRKKFKELGGKPSDSLNESLSRGSLYRRRYHGRY